MTDTILYQSPPIEDRSGSHLTMRAILKSGQSVYVGEFSAGIEKDAAVRRVVALFGDQLAWIDCTHYAGT